MWAALAVRIVGNAVNLLQAAGFIARVRRGSMAANHLLGYGIIGLAGPAAAALIAMVRARAGRRHWTGPAVYLVFIALPVVADCVHPIEFRSPMRAAILHRFLLLTLIYAVVTFVALWSRGHSEILSGLADLLTTLCPPRSSSCLGRAAKGSLRRPDCS